MDEAQIRYVSDAVWDLLAELGYVDARGSAEYERDLVNHPTRALDLAVAGKHVYVALKNVPPAYQQTQD